MRWRCYKSLSRDPLPCILHTRCGRRCTVTLQMTKTTKADVTVLFTSPLLLPATSRLIVPACPRHCSGPAVSTTKAPPLF